MLRRTFVLSVPAAVGLAQTMPNAELSQVQFLYLLPMGGGLDQHIANWLVRENVYQVVTDPKKAEAVLTDQIGAALEDKLLELYPPPPPPEEEKKEEDKDEKKDGGMEFKGDTSRPRGAFTRGRGNIFLVDLKSRRVLWSIYDRPKNTLPDELDKTSQRIVRQLKRAIQSR